jgi:RNA polymerase sigma-70 factor (ECF subfamily)
VSRSEFEEEALRWSHDVHRFALSMTRDETEAEDVVQDTYLRAFRSWKTFAPGTDCRRWLFTICRNVFLRSRERARRLVPVDSTELDAVLNEGSRLTWGPDHPSEGFANVDISSAIQSAVAGIPEPFRSAIVAVDLEDQSYETAATRLGVPIGTVRSRLFRGRRLLQERLRIYAADFGVGENILRDRGSLA